MNKISLSLVDFTLLTLLRQYYKTLSIVKDKRGILI